MLLPFVSIIIPTYDDWQRLNLCLTALSNQTYPMESFEIVVVNNKSDDTIPKGYELPNNCTLINEYKEGSYSARNAALDICRGEIVGFTDSDCIPDRDWIKNAINHLKTQVEIGRLGGTIKMFSSGLKPNKAELYDMMFAFPQEKYVQDGVSVTANLFVYKEVFDKVGAFKDNVLSGGDFEWGKRAQQKGILIGFAKDVIVNHPARDTIKALVVKARRVGKGQVNYVNSEYSFFNKIRQTIIILRPKTWEMKRIFENGRHLAFYDKVYLIALRHLILWNRDFSKMSSVKKNSIK